MSNPAAWTAQSLLNLDGLVALVTGSGTGIGLHIAKTLAANGAKVYITGRSIEKLETAIKNYGSFGQLVPLVFDITDKDSIRNAVATVEKNDGKLDILVNNAGINGPVNAHSTATPFDTVGVFEPLGVKSLDEFDFDEWTRVLHSNVTAPTAATFAFLDLLKKGAASRPGGLEAGATSSVINIGSTMSQMFMGMGGNWVYKAAKAGLDHLTKSLATDFAHKGIPVRVNLIAPGLFASERSGDDESAKKRTAEGEPWYLVSYPLKRAGKGEEVGATAAYLASNAGGYTNGTIIYVDGAIGLVNP